MFFSMFLKALSDIWPMIFIFTIILISVRILYRVINKKSFVFHKELLMLCFIVYILLLYYTVTFQDNNYGTNNFVPFKEIFRYNITSRLFIRNVLGNILLFIPFGIFTTYIIKNKTVFPSMFLGLLVSSAIEFAQSAIGRTADIDDIILNTVGSALGYLIYHIFIKFSYKLPSFVKKDLFLDLFSIIIVFLVLYMIYKFSVGGLIG